MIVKLWKTPEPNEAEVVARIVWLAKNADAEFAKLGLAFPYQVEDGRRALTAVDMEHSLCYFSRYMLAHDRPGRRRRHSLRMLGPCHQQGLPAPFHQVALEPHGEHGGRPLPQVDRRREEDDESETTDEPPSRWRRPRRP